MKLRCHRCGARMELQVGKKYYCKCPTCMTSVMIGLGHRRYLEANPEDEE